MKRTIKLTENELHNIIKESVNKLLNEDFGVDFDDTLDWVQRKRSDLSLAAQKKFAQNIINKKKREALTSTNKLEGYRIIGDNDGFEGTSFRTPWCYAHGKLEDDMGIDLFTLEGNPSPEIISNDGTYTIHGKHKCHYKGKPCTLYSGYPMNGRGPIHYGLVCYDDDIDAKEYILKNVLVR